MRWFFALILVGLSAAGCKSQAPVCDPFFSRTTIPPPATGAVTGRPADPCYQPPPLAPAGISPPTVQMPSQASSQAPPSLPQGTVAQPLTSQPTPQPAVATPPASPSGLTPNVLGPRPTSTGSTLAPRSSPQTPSSTPSWTPSPTPSAAPPSNPSPNPSAPAGSSPYTPPGDSFSYPGGSTRGASRPLSATTVATSRTVAAGDDRTPRPVDDTAGSKPIVSTLQPRGSNDASNRPVDILDLPKTP